MRRRSVVVSTPGITQTLAWGSTYYLTAVFADPVAADLRISRQWFYGFAFVADGFWPGLGLRALAEAPPWVCTACAAMRGDAGPLVTGPALDLFGRETVAGWGFGFGHSAVVTPGALTLAAPRDSRRTDVATARDGRSVQWTGGRADD
jgi:hypothetical protein